MTGRLLVFTAAILLGAGAVGVARAQSEAKMAGAVASADAQAKKGGAADNAMTTAMPADPGSVVLGDSATRRTYLNAMQRYYDYRANGYAYRSRVFEWQLFSSRVIFLIVLGLVGAGIYFAAVQFRVAMRAAVRPAAAAEPSPPLSGVSLATQLEISAKGVIVNSSVMGLIILALSLAFFYLYLVYVYPITDVL